jgi:hypothetical protein
MGGEDRSAHLRAMEDEMTVDCVVCGNPTEVVYGVRDRHTARFVGCALAWAPPFCATCAEKEASYWNFHRPGFEAHPVVVAGCAVDCCGK